MAIVVHRFLATQVLRIEVLPVGRANVPFLNWDVAAKAMADRDAARDAFSGAGLYGVCFDNQLIYIGSFLGSGGTKVDGLKGATFVGDVAIGRWWQHFGSITSRSHKLSVAPSSLDAMEQEFGPDHPMMTALRGATPDLSLDAGCLGALNRLRFAARHFDAFAGVDVQPANVLSRFSYVYARIDGLPPGETPHELSKRIKRVEEGLIRQYHPEVNTAGRSAEGVAAAIPCDQAGQVLSEALAKVLPRNPVYSAQSENASEGGRGAGAPRDSAADTSDKSSLLGQAGAPRSQASALGCTMSDVKNRPAAQGLWKNLQTQLPEGTLDAPDRPSAGELFFGSIAGNPSAEHLISSITVLCAELNVELHHTYTNGHRSGDLRIRARRDRPSSDQQNVVTLDWRPRAAHFSCRCLVPAQECVALGIHDEDVSANSPGQPLPTKLNAQPGRDDEALLAVVRRSVVIYREV